MAAGALPSKLNMDSRSDRRYETFDLLVTKSG